MENKEVKGKGKKSGKKTKERNKKSFKHINGERQCTNQL
jgi:hypothetical protein